MLLWLLLLSIVLVGVGGVLFARVAVRASGPAVVLGRADEAGRAGEVEVVALLPARHLEELRTREEVLVQPASGGQRSAASITAVGPEALSANAARTRFALDDGPARALKEPVAVVEASMEARSPDLEPAEGAYRASVELGSRRMISLLADGRAVESSR